ncbi:hypothetical protein OIU78_004658 [Salix suchowensis]|nr:hypothetical protein OIU78_004658 [Salix suchowensis]
MDRTTSPFFSSLESDFSTGYLEDALLEFNERSKRRRLLLFSTEYDHGHHDQYEKSNDLPESNWDEENFDDWELMSENFSCLSHIAGVRGTSDEPMMSTSMSNASEEANVKSEIKTPEEEISAPETLDYSSSSSYKDLAGTNSIFEKDSMPPFCRYVPLSLSLSHTPAPTISRQFLLLFLFYGWLVILDLY